MLTTPHILVGILIVKKFPNLWGAFLLALISHFILDFFIPHWNPHLYSEFKKDKKISFFSLKVILIDCLLAGAFFLYLSWQAWPDIEKIITYAGGAFFATLPDLVEIPYYFLHWKNKLLADYVHFEHQHQAKASLFWGLVTQLLVSLAALKQLFF